MPPLEGWAVRAGATLPLPIYAAKEYGAIQLHRLHSLIDLFYAAAVQTFCLATSNLGGTMDSQSLVVNLVQMGAPKAGWCEMKLPIYVSDLLIDNVFKLFV